MLSKRLPLSLAPPPSQDCLPPPRIASISFNSSGVQCVTPNNGYQPTTSSPPSAFLPQSLARNPIIILMSPVMLALPFLRRSNPSAKILVPFFHASIISFALPTVSTIFVTLLTTLLILSIIP